MAGASLLLITNKHLSVRKPRCSQPIWFPRTDDQQCILSKVQLVPRSGTHRPVGCDAVDHDGGFILSNPSRCRTRRYGMP
jgi:hypothetical protein